MLKNFFFNSAELTGKSVPVFWKAVCILFIVNMATHYPVFGHLFQTRWDDQWVAMNDYTTSGLNLSNIWFIMVEFYHGQYAPMNQLYYTVLYTCFGYNPFWFHLSGFLIHIINVVLVYLFISQLLSAMGNMSESQRFRISFFTALIFSVHPLLVESIDWIAASKILIYAMFYLLGLLAYLKYLKCGKSLYYWLCFLLFILSFGGKEQAVVMPLGLILIDYTLKRELKSWQVIREKLPFFLLAAVFGIVTLYSQLAVGQGALTQKENYSFFARIVFAGYTLSEYLIKCVIPIKLSYLYPFPMQIGEKIPSRFIPYPFIIPIVVYCFFDFIKRPQIFFGLTFFLIHIIIVLHIIPISRFAIVADRYVYVSSVGIFFLMAMGIEKIRHIKRFKIVAITVIGCYLIYLATYSNLRSRVWHSSDSLKLELKKLIESRNDYQKIKTYTKP